MAIFRLLFIGDIVGDAGVSAVEYLLPILREQYTIDFCVANGENAHEGRGINEVIVKKLYRSGVDVITGGDHSFDKHLIFPYMAKDNRLLRPMNYPKGAPGYGYGVYPYEKLNTLVAVINLRGQSFFNNPIRCPFYTIDRVLEEVRNQTNLIFLDFHAEATAEKMAMAWYIDGRISAMAGSHTHVQTGDEQIFPQGMGYITDVGFTGPHDSVIGMDKTTAINRFLLQTPQKYKLAEGNIKLHGVLFYIEPRTGKTQKVLRLSLPYEPPVLQETPQEVREIEQSSKVS
ncbi:MAG: TIGR00282 family metallophosphoesterase [Bacteroidia bacterium]|nr:TIGR00282 family metallophosphoesterase [Bacteroidia bacterium]MDW8158891.1 TIGR00282 family metallophosphoesterase [Bacteroidia bacterium]